ncbi:UNVERIFIED_CONTAM: hypothetical protein NCL1_37893 [Trichonephila clavipes]
MSNEKSNVCHFLQKHGIDQNHQVGRIEDKILLEVNVKGLMLHHEKASSHTAGLTVEFLKKNKSQSDRTSTLFSRSIAIGYFLI